MDEHGRNPFRRGPRAGSPPDREKRGRSKAPVETEAAPRRGGIRKLPTDLRDLAEGRVNRLRRPPRAPEPMMEPEGTSHVVPGVRNSDARAVYDRRVARLRAAATREDVAALESGLYEAQLLALWRARNVTDFDAFAEDVVGLGVNRARQLAAAGATRLRTGASVAGAEVDPSEPVREARPLSREFVALWVRTEAALILVSPMSSVRVIGAEGKPELQLTLPADPVPTAVEALRSLGPALTGLAKLTSTEVPERAPRPRDR
jgi:hypothetical protein